MKTKLTVFFGIISVLFFSQIVFACSEFFDPVSDDYEPSFTNDTKDYSFDTRFITRSDGSFANRNNFTPPVNESIIAPPPRDRSSGQIPKVCSLPPTESSFYTGPAFKADFARAKLLGLEVWEGCDKKFYTTEYAEELPTSKATESRVCSMYGGFRDRKGFDAAFASKRGELGPGQIFEACGNSYTTNFKEEPAVISPKAIPTLVSKDGSLELDKNTPMPRPISPSTRVREKEFLIIPPQERMLFSSLKFPEIIIKGSEDLISIDNPSEEASELLNPNLPLVEPEIRVLRNFNNKKAVVFDWPGEKRSAVKPNDTHEIEEFLVDMGYSQLQSESIHREIEKAWVASDREKKASDGSHVVDNPSEKASELLNPNLPLVEPEIRVLRNFNNKKAVVFDWPGEKRSAVKPNDTHEIEEFLVDMGYSQLQSESIHREIEKAWVASDREIEASDGSHVVDNPSEKASELLNPDVPFRSIMSSLQAERYDDLEEPQAEYFDLEEPIETSLNLPLVEPEIRVFRDDVNNKKTIAFFNWPGEDISRIELNNTEIEKLLFDVGFSRSQRKSIRREINEAWVASDEALLGTIVQRLGSLPDEHIEKFLVSQVQAIPYSTVHLYVEAHKSELDEKSKSFLINSINTEMDRRIAAFSFGQRVFIRGVRAAYGGDGPGFAELLKSRSSK